MDLQSRLAFADLEQRCHPAVFRNVLQAQAWPAIRLWSGTEGLQYLRRKAGDAEIQAMYSKSDIFIGDIHQYEPVNCRFATLLEAAQTILNEGEGGKAPAGCVPPEANDLSAAPATASVAALPAAAVTTPPSPTAGTATAAAAGSQVPHLYMAQQSLQGTGLSPLLGDAPVPQLLGDTPVNQIHLWMSIRSSRSSVHYDPYHNLLCVATGSKTVTLLSPSAAPGLYPKPLEGEASNHSSVNFADPGVAKDHPRYSHALKQRLVVTLNPGDALFIPEGWWHQVDSSPVTLAVNYWWPSQLSRHLQSVPHMATYYLRSLAAALTARAVHTLLAINEPSDGTSPATAADTTRLTKPGAELGLVENGVREQREQNMQAPDELLPQLAAHPGQQQQSQQQQPLKQVQEQQQQQQQPSKQVQEQQQQPPKQFQEQQQQQQPPKQVQEQQQQPPKQVQEQQQQDSTCVPKKQHPPRQLPQHQAEEQKEEVLPNLEAGAPPLKRQKTSTFSTSPAVGCPVVPPTDTDAVQWNSAVDPRTFAGASITTTGPLLGCLSHQELQVLQQFLLMGPGGLGPVGGASAGTEPVAAPAADGFDPEGAQKSGGEMAAATTGRAAVAELEATGGGYNVPIAPPSHQHQQHRDKELHITASDLWPAQVQQQHQAAQKQLLLALLQGPAQTAARPEPTAAASAGHQQHLQQASPGRSPAHLHLASTSAETKAYLPTAADSIQGHAGLQEHTLDTVPAGEDRIRGLGLEDGFTRGLQVLSPEGVTKVMYVLAVVCPAAARQLLMGKMTPAAAHVLTQKLEEAEPTFEALGRGLKECLQQADNGEDQEEMYVERLDMEQRRQELRAAEQGGRQLQKQRGSQQGNGWLPYASREDFYSRLYSSVEDAGELFQLMLKGKELLAAAVKVAVLKGCGLL